MHLSVYICYFGIREPLVQTQVLPYIRKILKAEGGKSGTKNRIALLTFEPKRTAEDKKGFAEIATELSEEGIDWHWLPYHKRPSLLATAWDVFRGTIKTRSLIRKYKPGILHARVHVPALIARLARSFSFGSSPKILFDIRGFFPEEYVDAGVWKADGLIYRLAKFIERDLLRQSDGFVVLTEKAREILFPESRSSGRDRSGRPVAVIPCCVDQKRFSEAQPISDLPDLADRFVVIYVGSFGGWYMTEEMIRLFNVFKEQVDNFFLIVLTPREVESIRAGLISSGLDDNEILVRTAEPGEVPAFLSVASVAVSLIKPCYSKLSSSPTKLAEYLLAGVPVVVNKGIGDVDELVNGNEVGIVLESLDHDSLEEGVARSIKLASEPGVWERCRRVAEEQFGLEEVGGPFYRRIYSDLGPTTNTD